MEAKKKLSKKKSLYGVCNLCEAICGLEYEVFQNKIQTLKGDTKDPLSKGHLCPKAYGLKDIYEDPDRIRKPMKRQKDSWTEISWDEALDRTAFSLKKIIKKYGANAVATYRGNPNVHNLDAMLHGTQFIKSIGSKNRFSASTVDQIPHQLVAHFMFGHQLMVPIPDISRTQYFLILGGNPMASNGSLMTSPDIFNHLKRIKDRGGKVVVVDPRFTETSEVASEHYFIKPGTDAVLLLGLLHLLFRENRLKLGRLSKFTRRIEKVERMVRDYNPNFVSEHTGIKEDSILKIFFDFTAFPKAVCYGRIGVSTQPFGSLCHWLINTLNILTGNMDSEGGAMFPLPAFDVHKFVGPGGYNRYQSRVELLPEVCGEFPVATLITEMKTLGQGQIKALMTFAGNPVLSTPNGKTLEKHMKKLDFMASVDFYLNETTRHSHIILPPTHFLESPHYDIIFNNFSIRNTAKFNPQILLRKKGSLTEGQILKGLQWRMERGNIFQNIRAFFRKKIRDVMTSQRIIDLGLRTGPYGFFGRKEFKMNLTLKKVRKELHGLDLGPLKPVLPWRIYRPSKKINIAPFILLKDEKRLKKYLKKKIDEDELYLIGRRHIRSNNSWMHNSERLTKGKDRCNLIMNPIDAKKRSLSHGEIVKIKSDTGSIEVPLEVSEGILKGVVSLPHGYGHNKEGTRLRVAKNNYGASINDLTSDLERDEVSGNAAFTTTRVKVSSVN